jgi:Sulfatase
MASSRAAAKPNIVVIWGDDIGIANLSCYTRGLMGYQTPNIDRIANEGMLFTDYYAEQSCTAGRASFITGQHGLRIGLTKVGFPAATVGLAKVGAVGRAVHQPARAEDLQSPHRPVRASRYHLEHLLGLDDRPRLHAGAGAGLCRRIPADLQGLSAAPEGRQLQPRRGASQDTGAHPLVTQQNRRVSAGSREGGQREGAN